MAKICLISLGCPKNLVDSEHALGELVKAGHDLTVDDSLADVIIVNTCGFIESAREESMQSIMDAVDRKTNGNCKAVIAVGCVAQKYSLELAKEIPELDGILGIEHPGKLAQAVERVLKGTKIIDSAEPSRVWVEHKSRVQATLPWIAYLRVSDGCNNRCSYCAIPDIRGNYRSRPENYIIDEAKKLVDNGVKELVLVGQDITQYGSDFGSENGLVKLVEKLVEIEAVNWIRLMYMYPTKVSMELIKLLASSNKLVKYMDMPLQHGDDKILGLMNRKGTNTDYLKVIDELRDKCPDIALRSSFIVGFPGEDKKAFNNLIKFVEKIRFDRVGVFQYSQEDGTPAYEMPGMVPDHVKEERFDTIMQIQQRISLETNKSLIGKRLDVLVEGQYDEGMYGRSYRDAPEIDGVVFINRSKVKPGEFVKVKITDASEYDLLGTE